MGLGVDNLSPRGVGSLALRNAAAFVGSWCLCLAPVLRRLSTEDSAVLREALLDGGAALRSAAQVRDACGSLQQQEVPVTRLPQ